MPGVVNTGLQREAWVFQEATTHPENPAFVGSRSPDGRITTTLREDFFATVRTVSLQRLRVLSAEPGSTEDEGYVTFEVSFWIVNQKGQRQKGNVLQIVHERGQFRRVGSRWLFLNGEKTVLQ